MPRFVTVARNRWRVTPLDQTRSRVSFTAQLQVHGVAGQVPRWLLLLQVRRTGRFLLDDLKHYVEQGTASPRKQRRDA
jgi:hypothetical protein